MVDKPLFGVFRQVLGTSVCYGGPFTSDKAEAYKKGLEGQMNFVNEEELRSRIFRVKPMDPDTPVLYSDGLFRPFKSLRR